jgi:excinuclease ABC subunit C
MPLGVTWNAPAITGLLPARPGVYRFRDGRGRVLYIGRAADLRSRVRSYWGGLAGRRHLRRMVGRIERIEAVVCQSRHEAAWLERSLLEHRMPRWNRIAGGLEVPVWLRIAADGVKVEHRDGAGARSGPFLGAVQTRCAADALERIYPFRLASGRSGSDREMGRVRGVTPGDGPRLRAAVTAVLAGDTAAVSAATAELVARRDAAVEVLDFERAATIQRELDGLTWILEPSRIVEQGPDLDLHGWAQGILLTFERRDGRIQDWRMERCTHRDAVALLASTPDPWRAFASENAALAAALDVPVSDG